MVPSSSTICSKFPCVIRRGIHVQGWIGRAGVSRQTRAQLIRFRKRGAIESGILSTALREGYHTALMRGQFPVTFLFVDLDPREVDVNVHPAKRESCVFAIRLEFARQLSRRCNALSRAVALSGSEKFNAPVPAIGGTTASGNEPIATCLAPNLAFTRAFGW